MSVRTSTNRKAAVVPGLGADIFTGRGVRIRVLDLPYWVRRRRNCDANTSAGRTNVGGPAIRIAVRDVGYEIGSIPPGTPRGAAGRPSPGESRGVGSPP